MLVYIDETSGSIKKLDQEEKCEILKYIDSFKEEIEGWLKYKGMESKDSRYTTMALQEFQHSLVMLDGIFTSMKGKVSALEQVELDKFKQSMK